MDVLQRRKQRDASDRPQSWVPDKRLEDLCSTAVLQPGLFVCVNPHHAVRDEVQGSQDPTDRHLRRFPRRVSLCSQPGHLRPLRPD